MIAHDDLHWDSTGQSYLNGDMADYFCSLEAALLHLAQRNGCRVVYPASTLPATVLSKLDYLHSFPQHATFACCLEQSQTNIETFSAQEVIINGHINVTQLAPIRSLLLPAACYTIYPTLRTQPAGAKSQLFTVQSRCFRNEKYYEPLERQWNFSMRELVCAGTEAQVRVFLDALHQQVTALCAALDLPVAFENATDPFFNPAQNPKYIMQRIAPSKTEVVYGGTLAIASLNFHRQYFGEAFEIRHGDDFCFTACVAFGLERWLAALFRQHGSNVNRWPSIDEIVPNLVVSMGCLQ
jgi:seryl-tRNA synthetase